MGDAGEHGPSPVTVADSDLIPADQAWFWTAEWQAGEREADADLAAGRLTRYDSAEALDAALAAVPAVDD